MIEAIVLFFLSLLFIPIAYLLKIDSIWIIIAFAGLMIPTFYAMFTGGPFVPSKQERISKMLKLAEIKKGQKVYDLGCGDGRIVQAAAKLGANAVGLEISPGAWFLAKIRCLFTKNCQIRLASIWQQNYQDADIIFCYLLAPTMYKFYQEIWPKLKSGTVVISNGFPIKDLKPDKQIDKVFRYTKS